ncbi:hypothetical protein NQZ68_009935 [Dissostichus eleginoides]|nr:hypothetical protein NQZ68_009935 [Dissostichus eleginoides]
MLKDSKGVEVDSDIFDELLNSSRVSFKAVTEECKDNNVEESSSEGSFLSDGSSSSSDSTITLESTKAWKRQLIEGPPDSSSARDEHFYDHQSGSGYLAWRLKTVQRNSAQEIEKSKVSFQGGPKTHRSMHSPVRQLSGDECNEAMSVMRHSSDITLVQDKMKATFQQRQKVVQDRATASTVLDLFPRFLDTSGLIEQDFTMLFGEEVSVWDCEVAAILLLLHLLPPTSKGKKSRVKISAKDAAGRLVKFLRVGKSIETFLKDTGPAQPFLLCIGERNDSIQHFYIVMDQKAIPCKT